MRNDCRDIADWETEASGLALVFLTIVPPQFPAMVFRRTHGFTLGGKRAIKVVPDAAKLDEYALPQHIVDNLHTRFVFHTNSRPMELGFHDSTMVSKTIFDV